MSFTHKRLNQNRHKIFGDNKNRFIDNKNKNNEKTEFLDAGSLRAAGTGERKMNKSKRSLKDFVWKGDCFLQKSS